MPFPEPYVHLLQDSHTHPAILLPGRRSTGPEFAELFSSKSPKGHNLSSSLPNWHICSWFDAYSQDDIHERQDLQVDGIKESVTHILSILYNRIGRLGGKTRHVYLGRISQGMATALRTLICATNQIRRPLGGFVGFCGWFPFAQQVEDLFQSHGSDDAWFPADPDRQAARVLQQIRIPVQWHEFTGADSDGHWIKVPEGFDQILQFLEESNSRA
ncbi:Alpha/Beta hydrolase protein [Aspergillus alliaceus]|uniref:Alpha/Beta hydrolase protein n=1 Tax=Petromyces alliaceus TaxID=209559 RepID=A0A5N7BYY8_PETAA|nr:Alpha/Beta hydrolase protein [Aspergillus alliaceus]